MSKASQSNGTARASVESAAQPARAAALPVEAPARKAVTLPDGWKDTVKEVEYTPQQADGFRTREFGTPPEGDGPVGVTRVAPEAEAGTTVDRAEPFGGFSERPVDESLEIDPAIAAEVAPQKDDAEVVAAPDATATTDTTEAPAETQEAAPTAKTPAAKRREALDALRLQAQNRKLVAELNDTKAKWQADTARQVAAAEALRGAPLEKRLAELGVQTKEELLEMAISGKLNLPDKRPEPEAPKAPTSEDLEQMRRELANLKGDQMARTKIAAAGLGHATEAVYQRAVNAYVEAGSKAGTEQAFLEQAIAIQPWIEHAGEALKTEAFDVPMVLADKQMVAAVKDSAIELWKADGFPEGKFDHFLKMAADAAENIKREQAAPTFKALGVPMPPRGAKKAAAVTAPASKPVAPKPPAPGAKPAVEPPVGKRVGARAPANAFDDDLPMDGPSRDAIIMKEMSKRGHKGWGESI